MAALSSPAKLDAFARLRRQHDARWASGVHEASGGAADSWATGIPGLDEPLGGGLPRGALTELVFAAPSSGGQLVLLHLLQAARRTQRFLGLIDGADGFDPQTIEPPELLRHLLWVRCAGAAQAMQTADVLARDANFHLLALDLRGCDERELRRTPANTWHRFQRVLEPTDSALVVLTPRRLVPAARARLAFTRPLPLGQLNMEQTDIAEQLAPELERRRANAVWTETASQPLDDFTGRSGFSRDHERASSSSSREAAQLKPLLPGNDTGGDQLVAEDPTGVALAG